MLLEQLKEAYPEKVKSDAEIFSHIHRGDRIFVGTACGEPQFLIRALVDFVNARPKAFFDAEVIQVWTLGIAPYTDEKFKQNFRLNSFFIGNSTRTAVNTCNADYTPIFLSHVPGKFRHGFVPIDIALIQTSLPDEHGYVNLGISVDIVKAAVEKAKLVIAQVNPRMPRVHGDGFVHLSNIDFIMPYDEPLLEYDAKVPDDSAERIGNYVAHLVRDGDTIQVGYGSLPNAILSGLAGKKHLGVHTELISDGIVALMKKGVIDNTRKSINKGKSVATFCMGKKETYEYLHDNPAIEFKGIDYTNNPLIIAQHENMIAINSALEIDLSGQATAESIGKTFYSGIGGQADFMRGAVLSHGGKTILAMQSTAEYGKVSRIVPFLREGAGVSLCRGDIHYVVTEYGIAYLNGKNIRERAMELISIAHPDFREALIEEAKKANIIYPDQRFITGKGGEYPAHLETYRVTKTGKEILLRPLKMTDETMYKDFIYDLSDTSLYRRFISVRKDMPHERRQPLVIIDYTREMGIAAMEQNDGVETMLGVGRYFIEEATHTVEVSFGVRDDSQNMGIGSVLLEYIMYLAKNAGFLGLTAEVLVENEPMLHVFQKYGFSIAHRSSDGMYKLTRTFSI